jgi:hypothetical protein
MDLIQQKHNQILITYGKEVIANHKQVKALLHDYAPENRREIRILKPSPRRKCACRPAADLIANPAGNLA